MAYYGLLPLLRGDRDLLVAFDDWIGAAVLQVLVEQVPGCYAVEAFRFEQLEDQDAERLRRSYDATAGRDRDFLRNEGSFEPEKFVSLIGPLGPVGPVDLEGLRRSSPG